MTVAGGAKTSGWAERCKAIRTSEVSAGSTAQVGEKESEGRSTASVAKLFRVRRAAYSEESGAEGPKKPKPKNKVKWGFMLVFV